MRKLYGEDRLYEEVAEFVAGAGIVAGLGKHESPIEELFAKAFYVAAYIGIGGPLKLVGENPDILFDQQAQIERFRVDFLFQVRCHQPQRIKIVVEVDGHDFHERTKEQAARDKFRDRRLLELGYRVMRFTGSEVYRSPLACAVQVWKLIHDASAVGFDWSIYDDLDLANDGVSEVSP